MKHSAIALTFATLLLAGTPVLAEPMLEPSAPGPHTPPVAMTDDAYIASPTVGVPAPEPRKYIGELNPDTPNPTKNTPGSEAKN